MMLNDGRRHRAKKKNLAARKKNLVTLAREKSWHQKTFM